jgi:hypothetical protein
VVGSSAGAQAHTPGLGLPSPALLSVAANAEGLLESRSIRPFSIEGISGAEAVDRIEEPMIEEPQHGYLQLPPHRARSTS